MNYLITYEDALRIVNEYHNFNFYKIEFNLYDYKVVTFNYFMCEPEMFKTPLKDSPEIDAYDMRGVTFVFNKDGSLFKRFLALRKFFNINQTEITQYYKIKNKKIKHVTEKFDGSLIAFMRLPDGRIFAKTIGSFMNDQIINSMKIYNDDTRIQEFVKKSLSEGYTPLFEYVSFDNRIVLYYPQRQLVFIGLRNNVDGTFISASELESYEIPKVNALNNVTLDDLLEKAKTKKDIEGWVVEFEDGQMVKIKTDWYLNLRGVRTVSIFREDYIIKNYLEETLDNVTQSFDMEKDSNVFSFIDMVKNSVNNWSNYIDKNVDRLVSEYSKYENDWPKFATNYHKDPFFSLAKVKIFEDKNEYRRKKVEYMLKCTNRLNRAKDIVEEFKAEK